MRILFIVLPLAVAWFPGVTAYLPPYSLLPARKTEPIEPQFEAEVILARSWPSNVRVCASRPTSGLAGNHACRPFDPTSANGCCRSRLCENAIPAGRHATSLRRGGAARMKDSIASHPA